MKFNRALSFALISNLIFASFSQAISKEMHALVRMETQSNAATVDSTGHSTRSKEFTRVEHYDIPMELIEASIADRANPLYKESLIHEIDGKKYLRWIINPEDTKWRKEVEDLLVKNGIKPELKSHFVGYMTASRSYIIVDPKNGAEFSFKGSTDRTGGNWKDKHQDWDDGKQIRMMTDFVYDQLKKQPALKNIVLLDEPMAFGLAQIDQGMIIRSYEDLTKSGKRYVPGFSIMHENLGREIAKANGSNDPAAFWNEHYNKPLARAVAEFLALTGMTYDSPHSQNFLVELDANSKPTGKIVLRDFGDTYLNQEFFNAVGRTDITKAWEQSNLLRGYSSVAVGILHGNKAPKWMDIVNDTRAQNSYDQWGRDFFAEFENEFQRQTGVRLKTSATEPNKGGMYRSKAYSMTDSAGQKFIKLAGQGKQRDFLTLNMCSGVFR